MLSFENSATFSKAEESGVALGNFWEPEEGFVWSTGRWCEIMFSFDNAGRPPGLLADLIIDIDVFKREGHLEGQNVLLYLNGLRIASYFVQRRTTYFASFDPKLLKPNDNVLTIDTPDTARPSDFGSEDDRLLGVQVFSLQVRKSG
jgi:hypothetical protein